MKIPDVPVTGAVGATLDLNAAFEVADTDLLAAFTKVRISCVDVSMGRDLTMAIHRRCLRRSHLTGASLGKT